MMDLKVEGTALQALIEKATIDALGTAGQEALVKEVVRYLTTKPSGNSYGRDEPSPLMRALHSAARESAEKFFREKCEKDPMFVSEIEKLYADAVVKFFDSETREKTIKRMVDRLEGAFGDRY